MFIRRNIIPIVAFIVACVACVSLFVELNSKRVGHEIGSYKGVVVYYNGINYARSSGKHYSNSGYYYGQKWQCVEYIKRFFYQAKGHKMPNVYGHAKDFFDSSIEQGGLNKERGLIQYHNGGNVAPQPDDLIVFRGVTQYGHIGIITEVTKSHVEVVHQNAGNKPRVMLPLFIEGGKYTVGSGRWRASGWLRLKSE